MRTKADNTQAVPDSLESLRELFKPHLQLPKARMTCFLMLVLAVIAQRTVSLVWLSKHPDTDASTSSVYRRFQRFFAFASLPSRMVGRLVLALVPRPAQGWILAIDRTNWQFGQNPREHPRGQRDRRPRRASRRVAGAAQKHQDGAIRARPTASR